MNNSFYINKLRVINRNQNIFDITFLDKEKYTERKPFSTVLIGSNGSGKSYLLSMISEVFRAVENKISNRDISLRYDDYYLEYYLNGNKYCIEIFKKKFKFQKNNITIQVDEVLLPAKVLTVAFMINDKFVFQTDEVNPESRYKYLGVRRTSNATWTNSIVRKISDCLITNIHKDDFIVKVKSILEFLSYTPKITLVFEPETINFFKRGISPKQLLKKIQNITKENYYRSSTINKSDIDIEEMLVFINETAKSRLNCYFNNKISLQYDLNFEKLESAYELKKDYRIVKYLIDLRLIKAPNLTLYKNDEFAFEFASSGEKQFLFTMINIASQIENNSLILIDEPEISFHPNWQMLYINYLKTIFSDFASCHFILATHSHYIVSDLEEASSSLLVINNNNMEREAELIEYSTYAWSAENILYNIFKVRTTRNYYFEMDLRKLVSLIKEKSEQISEIEGLIVKLKKYILDDADPMILILEEAQRYIENVKAN